ncbi:tyrosine-type recombinase/integrase [Streptomyces jeddahensis]|uniref:tyrosine-type recombinase/integrase n=1 Tax=Streptomyces jeddahensis TaxID=1716141 RepID=UPI0012FF7E56|nr:tyrosine-type recombinase/integrase [Streptomyces jeddahensis]
MSTEDEPDEVVDAELVPGDSHLPVIRHQTPLVPDADPDAWLPPEAAQDVADGIAQATRDAYELHFTQFAKWCAMEGRRHLPAAGDSVTAYVSHLTRTPREKTGKPYSPSTLDSVIAAIRTVHRDRKLPVPETKGARQVVTGYRERLALAKDAASRPNKASPAKRDVLRRAVRTLDRTTLAGRRDAALMLLGHACATRGGELVHLDIESLTPDDEGRGFTARLYRRKLKKWQDVGVFYDEDEELCPVRATYDLIDALELEGHTTGPLFLRMDRWGYLAPPMQREGKTIGDPTGRMTAEAASDIVERAMARAGQPGRWRSHSLRRGFVNSAREAGVDIVDIGRHGGWADGSKALIGYIEEADAFSDSNPLAQINEAERRKRGAHDQH